MMPRRFRLTPIALVMIFAVTVSCSTKKNTAASRFWQAFTTRYNVYYHGATNYDEQIKILENEYQDDYSQRLFIHPAEAYSHPKSPQPSGSFDRTIEKMQKAISLHSIKKKPKRKAGKGNDPKYREWLKRDEYNPFIHNAWYLMAKAQYMKGDFLSSAATFHYIYRHFTWKPKLVQEAQIWEALSYCAMGWRTEADNVLAHIHIDKIEDNKLRALANLAFADYYITDKQTDKAVPYLAEAVKGAKGSQKVRLNFLLGQLYEELGKKDLAYVAYKRAGSSNSSSYRTNLNARIKQSAVFSGTNIEGEVRSLKHMTRYDRNKEYLDQIYYAIGNLYLSRGDTAKAVDNYVLAAEKSTRNGIDKAVSQLTLGGIYFAQHKYDKAQPCYSEAIPLISEDYPNYKMLKQRSDVLDELAVYAQNVTLQDSLLRLSRMTPEEQKAVIKKIIDELKKKEKEEAENAQREEYLAQQAAKGNNMTNKNAPQTFQINNDDSWYFYNTTTKNAGKTAFQQMWGNRKLEDDWRRRNKNTFSFDDEEESGDSITTQPDSLGMMANDSTAVDKEALKRSEDPHYEEYYLKQIPSTPEEIQTSHDVIQEGLFNMGVILKDKLEDYLSAENEFNRLLTDYPDNIYRLDIYYNMYLMYMRNNEIGKAEQCRQLILTHFADSKYGMALQDPQYLENLKRMDAEQERMYSIAYNAYLDNDNATVHESYAEMMRKYPLSKIMPKFMFIDALSYVTEKNPTKFKEVLKEMLERYPDTDITPTASAMVKSITSGRKLGGSTSNVRGMLWSTRLGNDSLPQDIERQFTPFTEELDKPQLFVLVFSTDSVSSNKVLYEVAKHNFSTFVVKDFDMEQMTFGSMGLLIVKGFENYDELLHYRSVWEQDTQMDLPMQVHPVLISESNFNLLLNEGRSFEEYFRYLDELNSDKVEEQIPEEATDDEADEGDSKEAEKAPAKSVKGKKGDKKTGKKEEKAEEPKPVKDKDKDKGTEPDAADSKPSEAEATAPIAAQSPASDSIVAAPDTLRAEHKTTAAQDTSAVRDINPAIPITEQPTTPELDKHSQETDKAEQSTTTSEAEKKEANKDIKRLKKQKSDEDKQAERERKAQQQAEKERIKAEKEHAKAMKEEEKALKKQQEKLRKQQEDSIKRVEKEREKALKQAAKAHEDSLKNVAKMKEQERKQKIKDKENQRKLKEEERKQRIKEKEQQRKLKEEERKQRQKEREAKKKEERKQKEAELKQKQKEREQRKKEREEERKQRQKERKAERKAAKK